MRHIKPVHDPAPGDLAYHRDGLDPREVTRVDGSAIYIDILGTETGPVPAANYTFTRVIESVPPPPPIMAGRVPWHEPCEPCDGTGQVYDTTTGGMRDCRTCGGTGHEQGGPA